MDKLRAIQLFVRLADLGSFTRVAEQVNSSKSMISKEISRLEADLGTRLLHRSTRSVQLTHVGEGYLQRAREILSKLDDADNFVQDLQQNLRGKLKINAPMALGITDLSHLFADFMKANPEIELDIHLGDESVDLVEQGFDLGFRASSQPIDSNYVGRPLTRFTYKVCVSPDYLKMHSTITHPRDLKEHNCFIYSYFQGKNVWPIEGGIEVKGSLRVNNTMFMMESIKQGLGIGFIPDFVCQQAINSGQVVEVLADSKKSMLTLYALYPVRNFVPPKLVQCIEYLEQWFADKDKP
ncbi:MULTISPECIES: LysR family transcriptional regulator [Colwellia]|uniref:Transcriptional regulator, LysR family n=1 Tax=Colwellia psychrerythraea (strain 34H / ATCC BAA-681) TaxID=167879 RepID=Q480Y1_COLP3|nr:MULTISPECIES: LysR family transcriptional regulator [Colwellia]AAZ26847.1 transcriptional regulator, LysR family [Colwellia psychrerythraea 34H]PKH87649.1 LysR family transcriptional regulator [Colwellia sp. Bg11-28]